MSGCCCCVFISHLREEGGGGLWAQRWGGVGGRGGEEGEEVASNQMKRFCFWKRKSQFNDEIINHEMK